MPLKNVRNAVIPIIGLDNCHLRVSYERKSNDSDRSLPDKHFLVYKKNVASKVLACASGLAVAYRVTVQEAYVRQSCGGVAAHTGGVSCTCMHVYVIVRNNCFKALN